MHTELPRRYSILLPRQYDQNPWLGLVPLLTAVLLGVIVAWLPFQVAVVLIVGSLVILLTLIQPLFGLGLAWYMYIYQPHVPELMVTRLPRIYTLLKNKYLVDEFYNRGLVQPVLRFSQGVVQKSHRR